MRRYPSKRSRKTNPRFHVRNRQYSYVAQRRTSLRLTRVSPAPSWNHNAQGTEEIGDAPNERFFDACETLTAPRHLPNPGSCHCFTTQTGNPATTTFDTDSIPICVDTGASYCSTTTTNDFLPGTKVSCDIAVTGLATHQATSRGTVRWRFQDDIGQQHSFDIPDVLHLPHLQNRLLSPQHWAQTFGKEAHCDTRGDRLLLEWGSGQYRRTVYFGRNNIALLHTAPGFCRYAEYKQRHTDPRQTQERTPFCFPAQIHDDTYETEDFPDVTHFELMSQGEADQTSTSQYPERRELTDPLRVAPLPPMHSVEEHTGTPQIVIDFMDEDEATEPKKGPELPVDDPRTELMRWHRRLGHTPFSKLQHMAQSGILPRRLATIEPPKCAACIYGTQTRRPWRVKGEQGKIRSATLPGECVSVDTLESTTLGFIGQLKGILTTERYKYATVFVDHFSRLSYVHLHRTNHATEVLAGKKAFEQWADSMHVKIANYHADNGRFADNLWLADIARSEQTITYCGVNAHWMNGIAEKRIRDLCAAARTNLIDAKDRWPKAVHAALWPYALRHANEAHMATPGKSNDRSPLELFSNSTIRPNLRHFHPFACPVYVLDDALQGRKPINRWFHRSRMAINLGFSAQHARTVALVLNPQTGLVSPQFHTKFDDFFETVNYPRNTASDPATWQTKARLKHRANKKIKRARVHTPAMEQNQEMQTPPQLPKRPRTTKDTQSAAGIHDDIHDDETIRTGTINEQPVRTSGRIRKPSRRQIEHETQTHEQLGTDDMPIQGPMAYCAVAYEALATARHATQEAIEAHCFASSVGGRKKGGDPDTLSFGEAMKAEDKDRFIDAMAEEVAAHEGNNNWELFPRAQVPAGHPISRGVWSMKRKRRILTGEIYKYKSRLTFDGSQQIAGLNYWDTFSPVVNVGTVRLFYNLAMVNKWHTRQLDFILAYPQAPAPTALFMNIPQGFQLPRHLNSADYCLRLRKNVYGNKEGGRAWYEHLWRGLQHLHFERSSVDRCVFYRGTVIMLVYVDDCILMGPNKEDIDRVFHDLKQAGYGVEDEGDLSDFLGVNYSTTSDGLVQLKQDKLVRQILDDMNFTGRTTTRDKPALVGNVLQRHKEAPDHKATWNYRSIIGKLNFLLSTRPDLAYAVHNAARHSHAPKEPHSKAVQQIVRYLAGTQDKGMVLRPEWGDNVRSIR